MTLLETQREEIVMVIQAPEIDQKQTGFGFTSLVIVCAGEVIQDAYNPKRSYKSYTTLSHEKTAYVDSWVQGSPMLKTC